MNENEKFSQTIQLKDGRRLGYAEFGNPKGKPVFHFHGWPGSRLEGLLVDEVAKKVGIRFIGVDRPGMGLSDFKPKRTLLDWPDDMIELANALNIKKFYVEGISGGGPYSAACAYKIPDRLIASAILGGLGPIDLGTEGMMKSNRVVFFMALNLPWLFRFFFWLTMGRKIHDVESVEKMLMRGEELPDADSKLLRDPKLRKPFAMETFEAFRQGTKGPAFEAKLYAKPWGFNLKDISPQLKVYLYHGELDVNVPIKMGHAMAEAIPNCKATFYAEEAHLSTALNHLEEIMKTIIS